MERGTATGCGRSISNSDSITTRTSGPSHRHLTVDIVGGRQRSNICRRSFRPQQKRKKSQQLSNITNNNYLHRNQQHPLPLTGFFLLLAIVLTVTPTAVVEAKITFPLSNLFSKDQTSSSAAMASPAGADGTGTAAGNAGSGMPSSTSPPQPSVPPTATTLPPGPDDIFLQEPQRLLKETISKLWTQYLEDTARIRSTIYKYTKATMNFVWYNIVLYKPPVGIVTAWTVMDLITSGRVIRGIQNIANGGVNPDGKKKDYMSSELALQQRKGRKLDRHTGRALDLDHDDMMYQKYGGIERVRRQLAWEALGTFTNKTSTMSSKTMYDVVDDDSGDGDTVLPSDSVLPFLDSLDMALKTEFSPGGSHAEHVHALIEPIAKVEQNAINLGLFPPTAGGRTTPRILVGGPLHDNKMRPLSEDEVRLLRLAVQSAEIHVLDSTLRLIRDRLLRTSFRLSRSVKYWRNRVQSKTTFLPTFILNAFNPIIRDIFSGGVEGDRTRLALAEAAYNTEIQRLGKILNLLADRPLDMYDPKLTLAVQKSLLQKEELENQSSSGTTTSHILPGSRFKKQKSFLQKISLPSSFLKLPGRSIFSTFSLRYNADGRGRFSFQYYGSGVTISSSAAMDVLLDEWESVQQPWLNDAQSWSIHARSLIFDTIQEALETSIQTTSSLEEELAKCQSTWKLQRYDATKKGMAESSMDDTLLEQWTFIYTMARDIGRFRRVGEGKSLKLKEVNVIQWLQGWDLLGLPTAALKIYAASIVHQRMLPHWPMIEKVSREIIDTSLEIFQTRFWIPVKDLVDELMNRESNPLLTGVSLQDEETSLDYMLRDLGFGDGTSATRHEAMIKASRQYESDINTGLIRHAVGGRLVRLILIQVQQLKVGMLDAAKTIDVLFQSNRFNIQLLAIIPATVIVWLGSKIVRRFLFTVRVKEIRPMKSVHSEMTEYLDSMESIVLLSKNNQEEGGVHQQYRPVSNLMSEKQMGEFALAMYDYLLLLDYSSPQPFPKFQCDLIHETMTNFLGKGGSLGCLSSDSQLKFIKLVKGKHEELSKNL